MPVRSRLEGGDDVICLSDQDWRVVMMLYACQTKVGGWLGCYEYACQIKVGGW